MLETQLPSLTKNTQRVAEPARARVGRRCCAAPGRDLKSLWDGGRRSSVIHKPETDPAGGQGRGRSNAGSLSSQVTPNPLIITFSSAFLLPTSSLGIQTRDHVSQRVAGSRLSGSVRSPQRWVPAATTSVPPHPAPSSHGSPPASSLAGTPGPERGPSAEGRSQPPCQPPLSLSACSGKDGKPDPNRPLLPKKQGTERVGRRQARNEGLGLQTNRAGTRGFRVKGEELSCDNRSTTAKFSGLFSEIQMLGKYNLITSAGAGVQQSPSWCFALFLHHVQTQEPTSETLRCHRSLAAPAEAASSAPVPRRCRMLLAEHALILPWGGPVLLPAGIIWRMEFLRARRVREPSLSALS